MITIIFVFCFILIDLACAERVQKESPRRSRAPAPSSSHAIDFDCPEEFGYYAHPTDCTQYYVCVFGGALLESCTGGLMYSHELQTCDWPRNVGCAPGTTNQLQPTVVQQREQPEIRSRGQSSRLLQQQQAQREQLQRESLQRDQIQRDQIQREQIQREQIQREQLQQSIPAKHDLYTEEEQLGPAEELESDRQQRVYRGQPQTIGQVASDRDAIAHTNAIPVQSGGREKLSVVSFGTQQQYSSRTSGDIRLDKSDHNFLTNGPRKKRHTLLSHYHEGRQPKFDGQPLSWSSYHPKVLYRYPSPSLTPSPISAPPIQHQHQPFYHRRHPPPSVPQPVKYKFNPSDARAINYQLQLANITPASSLQHVQYQKYYTSSRAPSQLFYLKDTSQIQLPTTPRYQKVTINDVKNSKNYQTQETTVRSSVHSQKTGNNHVVEDESEEETQGSQGYAETSSEMKNLQPTTDKSYSKLANPPEGYNRDESKRYEDRKTFARHDFTMDKLLANLKNSAVESTVKPLMTKSTQHLYHANYLSTDRFNFHHTTTKSTVASSTSPAPPRSPPIRHYSDDDYYDYEDYDNRTSSALLRPSKVPKRLQELDNEEYEDGEEYYDSEDEDYDSEDEDEEEDEDEDDRETDQIVHEKPHENTKPKLRIVVDQTTPQFIIHSTGYVTSNTRCPPKKRCFSNNYSTRRPLITRGTTERVPSQNRRPMVAANNPISTRFAANTGQQTSSLPDTSQPTPFTTSITPPTPSPDIRKKLLRQRLNKPQETDLRQDYKDKAHTQRTLTMLRASVTPAQQAYVEQQQNIVPSRGYNSSRYVPSQYDSSYFSLYDEEDLYKDLGDFTQYNTQTNYRSKKPQIEIVQQEPVQRGSTYSKSKYNTQAQDIYQSVTPQEYDTYSIQTNDDLPYRQTIQTKPSTRSGVKEIEDGSIRSRIVQPLSAIVSKPEENDSEITLQTELTSTTQQAPVAERLIQTPTPFHLPETTTFRSRQEPDLETQPLTINIAPRAIGYKILPRAEAETTSRPTPIRSSESADRGWIVVPDRRGQQSIRGDTRGSAKYQGNPFEIDFGDDESDEKVVLATRLGPIQSQTRVTDNVRNEELERRIKLQYLQHKNQENRYIASTNINEQAERSREELRQLAAEELVRKTKEENRRKQLEEEAAVSRRKQLEENDRKAKEEARRRQIEEEENKAKEEARRRQLEEADRKAKEEVRRRQVEEADRKAKEEARKRQLEEADRKAKEEARRRQIEEEEARRRQIEEEEKQAKEEARRKQEEEAELRARIEARQRQIEEAINKTKEEARRKQEQEEETRRLESIEAERETAEKSRRIFTEDYHRDRNDDNRRRIESPRAEVSRVPQSIDNLRRNPTRGSARGEQSFRIIVDNSEKEPTTYRSTPYTDTRPPKKYVSRDSTLINEPYLDEQVTEKNAIYVAQPPQLTPALPRTEHRKIHDTTQSVLKTGPVNDDKSLRVRPTTLDTQSTPGTLTRTNSRHRGTQTYTISPNEAESPNRGTPVASRNRPTLKPSNSVIAKAAEFIDIYRFPPSRPENIYPTPQVDKTAAKCRKDVCLLPDCSCGGKEVPGDLPLEETPQIVLLTFDDSVNDLNKGLYSDLFEKGRVNPNGCPISGTFYVSHEWTDYSQVQNLYATGHEIASHSVSHSFGEQFSQRKWTREISGQREILSAYGGVRLEDVRGMRAPFLAVGGNKMFKMLYDSNFTYDSSMPVYENRPPSWPYTLDYKVFHDCMIPPCPTRSYPGVWEVPMVMWQDLNGGRCSMGDACSNPPNAEGVYKMLLKNFERHFTTNRAPFGLFYHAAWFTQPHHKEGFIAFLDTINKMPEVWLVTNWQAIQWVRDPTPISRLNNFAPFQCNYPERPKKCNNPKVCNLWHKSGVRYMRTCQPCPEVYPWTGKSGVRNSRVDNEIINE